MLEEMLGSRTRVKFMLLTQIYTWLSCIN